MKAKDIFGLAVRLLGLIFLYLGLNAIAQALGSDLIEAPDKSDIVNGVLPIVFYLIMAGFLIRGRLLINWAYPEKYAEKSQLLETLPSTAKPITSLAPLPQPVPSPESRGLDRAEEKLAALVEKPKETRAA
jgi:hypothetical protein